MRDNNKAYEDSDSNSFIPESVYQSLPEFLMNAVEGFKDRERDMVLLSSIVAIGSCIPNIFGIYDRSTVYPNLYLFVIAPPASDKGAIKWSKLLVDPIHDLLQKNSQKRINEYQKLEDKSNHERPKFQIKLVPGNISSSKLYQHIKEANDSILFFETEADTISNMFKSDWGNISDILRKAFHHEEISISRKENNLFIDIKEPKLSMIISGTPNQLIALIESIENGLFSRFMFYSFNKSSKWRDVSPNASPIKFKEKFNKLSTIILKLFLYLSETDKSLEVRLSERQWNILQNRFAELTEMKSISNNGLDFSSCIKRHGLIAFRISIIMTVLRNIENLNNESQVIQAQNLDVKNAVQITHCLLGHSSTIFNTLAKNNNFININEEEFFKKLGKSFNTNEAQILAYSFNIKERTFFRILDRFEKANLIQRISRGVYKKTI